MSMIFFTFRAQMRARQGVNLLKKAGIPARMGKTPSRLAGRGCGYGIWVPEYEAEAGARQLHSSGLSYEKSYRMEGDQFREVWL